MPGQEALAFLVMIAAISGPVWLYVARCAIRGEQPLRLEPRPAPQWNVWVVGLALFLTGYVLYRVYAGTVLHPAGDVVREPVKITLLSIERKLVEHVIIITMLMGLLVLGRGKRVDEADFGITLKKWRSQVAIGALAFVACLLPVYTVQVLSIAWRSPETQHPFLTFLEQHQSPMVIAWVLLTVVVTGPLAEELQYRVVLQGWLESLMPARWAILATAVVFSLVHGFPDALGIFPLALILCYVFHRRHNLLAVFTLHALFNALNTTLSLLGPHEPREAAATAMCLVRTALLEALRR